MKEEKVWVEKMTESCDECKYYTQFDAGMGCMITQELRPMDEKENYIQPDCPLADIKTHDRELIKEVCEKIRENIEARNAYELDIINRLAILLDKIEKEFEK